MQTCFSILQGRFLNEGGGQLTAEQVLRLHSEGLNRDHLCCRFSPGGHSTRHQRRRGRRCTAESRRARGGASISPNAATELRESRRKTNRRRPCCRRWPRG